MRKPFKSFLRHGPISKRQIVEGPTDPEIVDVTILPQWDTVLRYDGSPLMVNGTVNDPGPDNKPVVPGENVSYKPNDENGDPRDWIAIGLATDNIPDDKFRSPNPFDSDAADDDITDGVVYTNTGPTRSVLSFDLEDIPAEAEILSAVLELVPVEDKSNYDAWDEFDNSNIVWPDSGVLCEILNLVEETQETCTWNTLNNQHLNGYPVQSTRWHRQTNSEQLPNPIGAMQNSKRWDVTEGTESFSSKYTGSVPIADIDSDGTEIYGHVGYGAMGGGAVENVPPVNKNDLDQFDISFAAHEAQNNSNENTPVFPVIDVERAVKYAHAEQNRTCNLLLRATHWIGTDLTEDQTEEIEEVFIPPALELNSITLEDESDLDTEVDLDHNAIVRFNPPTFDADGNPDTQGDNVTPWVDYAAQQDWNVNYDWQVKYPPIEDITFEVHLNDQKIGDQNSVAFQNFVVGDKIEVKNISSTGGFENLHRYEIYVGDGDQTGSRSSGINVPLTLFATDFPDTVTQVGIVCSVNVQAQGANVALNEGGADEGFFPETTIENVLLGTIVGAVPDDEDTPSQFSITYSPVGTEDNDFGSPIEDMNAPITVHVTFTVTDFRPGFDWNQNHQSPVLFVIFNRSMGIRKIGDQSNQFIPRRENDTFSINGNVATNEFDITFTAQEIIDSKEAFFRGDSFELTSSLDIQIGGTDQGVQYIDTFPTPGSGAASERYEFTIAQDSTPNNFDITDPNNRRGVFDTIGLQTFSDSTNAVTGTLANSPESSVKAVLRQVELAPCQLKCDSTESFTTVLMPIEELSRFHGNQSATNPGWPGTDESFAGIRGTKNKFAVLSGAMTSTNDESGIRNFDTSPLVVPGNPAAKIDLVTSGGIGERIERKRNVNGVLTDILVPSDLAVYYYNKNSQQGVACAELDCTSVRDNTGEDCNADGCPTVADVGWVYYRGLSNKANLNPGGRFRPNGSDYDASDFNVPNTDHGLEFVQWEKLAGDPLGLLDTAGGFDGTDPNIGAYIFLLDDRYDNVETLTDGDLSNKQKWPVPFSSAFPLNVTTPDASTPATEIRNNPTLFELFEQAGSDIGIVDIIDYRLKSLDNGTEGNSSIVFDTAGVLGPSPDSDIDGGDFTAFCPTFPSPSTRDADGKLAPLSNGESLFISGPTTVSGDDAGVDVYEVTTYSPDDNIQKLDRLFEGAECDFLLGEYCNYKSHFWNGKGTDIVRADADGPDDFPFENNSNATGSIPLIWRRADTQYFSHLVDRGSLNASSTLPEPITDSISTESTLAYHGINIYHSKLHEKLKNAAANTNDPDVVPFVQYIVEVVRGGCVYHRDIYRLSGVQGTDPNKRTRADGDCPSCLQTIDCCETDSLNCGSALALKDNDPTVLMDTLYQFGLDGRAWEDDTQAETSWYAPSDWRAGDTVRIYAIVPHTADDTVVDEDGNPISVNPTPAIARIKKYCPVGDPVVPGIPKCCEDSPEPEGCECIVVCRIPPFGGGDVGPGTNTGTNPGGNDGGGGGGGGGDDSGGGQAGGGGQQAGGGGQQAGSTLRSTADGQAGAGQPSVGQSGGGIAGGEGSADSVGHGGQETGGTTPS